MLLTYVTACYPFPGLAVILTLTLSFFSDALLFNDTERHVLLTPTSNQIPFLNKPSRFAFILFMIATDLLDFGFGDVYVIKEEDACLTI
jgi:hypothetical protein